MSNIERNVVDGRYSGLALLMDVCHRTGGKFSSEPTLLAWFSWRSRTQDACGAVRNMCGLARGLAGRDQRLNGLQGQALAIEALGGAGLPLGEPSTGPLWCLLAWEAQ